VRYTVGFRSGAQITLEVRDPEKLLKDIFDGLEGKALEGHWYRDKGGGAPLAIYLSAVEFIYPCPHATQ
jgi:hypothetical protein